MAKRSSDAADNASGYPVCLRAVSPNCIRYCRPIENRKRKTPSDGERISLELDMAKQVGLNAACYQPRYWWTEKLMVGRLELGLGKSKMRTIAAALTAVLVGTNAFAQVQTSTPNGNGSWTTYYSTGAYSGTGTFSATRPHGAGGDPSALPSSASSGAAIAAPDAVIPGASMRSPGGAIGAGSGAVLGAVTPVGVLPGALIGGAVGAGVGAATTPTK
jgi:hypothetical protein